MLSFDKFISEAFVDPKVLNTGINKIVSFLNSKGYSFSRFGGPNYVITFVKKVTGGGTIKSSQAVFVSPQPDGPCLTFNVEASRSHSSIASVNFFKSYDGKLTNPEFELVSKGTNLTNLAKAIIGALNMTKAPVGPAVVGIQEIRKDDSGRIADPERRKKHESGLIEQMSDLIDEMKLYDINVNAVLSQNAVNISDEIPSDMPEIDAMIQYDDLKHAVRSLVAGEHKCVFVAGSAGVGKTFNVVSELKELGTPFKAITGSVTSMKAAYEILFNNRQDGKVLLIDDCDSFFNPANVNILKGALGENNGENYRCSYVSGDTLDVTRWPEQKVEMYTKLYDAQKSADDVLFDELAAQCGIIRGGEEGVNEATKSRVTAKQVGGNDGYQWTVFVDGRAKVNGLTKREVPYYLSKYRKEIGEVVSEAADYDEDEEMEDGPRGGGAYFPKEIMKAIEKGRQLQMPSSFVFEARAVFITNIPPENFRRDPHLRALLDRGEMVPIVLNQKQVFDAMAKILPHFKHLKVDLGIEEKKSLLEVVHNWYLTNKPNQNDFPSFRSFVLLFPHRKSGGNWQAYVERALKNKAG